MLMIRGSGCFVFAPPSIAMPRMGFDFFTVMWRFPRWSGTMWGGWSWHCSSEEPFWSIGSRCIDWDESQLRTVSWMCFEGGFKYQLWDDIPTGCFFFTSQTNYTGNYEF
uniref:(northern house mosquito) hypothetical protein n=1 Tax=Culex pipiens TaxID=7175 RepID=A0A8D8FYM7_CULPI